jgi:hypothetical protein
MKRVKKRTSRVIKNKNHNLYNKNHIMINLGAPIGSQPQNATGHLQRSQTMFQPSPLQIPYVFPQQPTHNEQYLQHRLVEQTNQHRTPVVNPPISSNDIASVSSGDNSKDILLPEEIDKDVIVKKPRKDIRQDPFDNEKEELKPKRGRPPMPNHTRTALLKMTKSDIDV